jgi:glyceraldehyde 3-phosphate dehydrogenase
MTKIAINGFGRIGRTVLRQLLTTRADSGIEVALINDIADVELCAYLFAHDSVFGVFADEVNPELGAITIGGKRIPFTNDANLENTDLSGIDIVLECAGHAKSREIAMRGLKAGAKQVLISGPSEAADVTVVMGANDSDLKDAQIVSNGSCTTNAEAPLLKLLDDALGLVSAHLTTIHCYTGSQPMIDAPRGDMARSRAGALSMVPTTTSATRLVKQILPHLEDKITGAAVRVPTASVSAVDLTALVNTDTSVEALNALLREADANIIGTTSLPLVSTDLRARSESFIAALPETLTTNARQIRVFGWYDNEWGFSSRMIDMALRMSAR